MADLYTELMVSARRSRGESSVEADILAGLEKQDLRVIEVAWDQARSAAEAWGLVVADNPSTPAPALPFPATLVQFTDDPGVKGMPGVVGLASGDDRWAAMLVQRTGDGSRPLTVGGICAVHGSVWDFKSAKAGDDEANSAMAAISILGGLSALLESANVHLVESAESQPVRGSRAHRDGVEVRSVVVIRPGPQNRRGTSGEARDFSHRFERRAHFKHHYRLTPDGKPNRVFAAWERDHPERIIEFNGEPCVRIWTPAHVVGPDDKPLVPKVRRVADTTIPTKGNT